MTRLAQLTVAAALAMSLLQLSLLVADAGTATDSETGVNPRSLLGAPEGRALQGQELDEKVSELASIMRCPVCQGLSIEASPVETARAMKAEIRDLVAQGYTRQQVLTYFETRYGEFVLLQPKAQGLNLLLWLAPGLALLLGLFLVANRRRSVTTEEVQEAGVEDYLERVQQETTP